MGAPLLLSTGVTGSVSDDRRGKKECYGCPCFCRLPYQEDQVDQVVFQQLVMSPKAQSMEGCNHLHVCWERMSGMQSGEKFQQLLP